jgi:hypothetical protein
MDDRYCVKSDSGVPPQNKEKGPIVSIEPLTYGNATEVQCEQRDLRMSVRKARPFITVAGKRRCWLGCDPTSTRGGHDGDDIATTPFERRETLEVAHTRTKTG